MTNDPPIVPVTQAFDYVGTDDPTTGTTNVETGEMWYETDTDTAYVYDGTAWVEISVTSKTQLTDYPFDSGDVSDVSADSASAAHHGKTSSASELTDVSPDSTAGAHHSQTQSGDVVVEDTTTNSTTSGEVPQSQGDGTLSMGTVASEPNVPNWQEDGNSPFSATDQTTKQHTFASDWDEILIKPIRAGTGSLSGFSELQVNGVTSNYTYVLQDTTDGSVNDRWGLNAGTNNVNYIKIIANENEGSVLASVDMAGNINNPMVQGTCNDATAPINSITAIAGSSRDWEFRAFGLNIY